MFGIFRLFLAVNVVVYHLLGVSSIGPFAVYSFFVLSGFLMTLIMKDSYGYETSGLKKYFTNRFLRLYPVYWFLLVISMITVILIGSDVTSQFHPAISIPKDVTQILANITMIYPHFEPVTYPVRLLPATWALTIELFFYFVIGIGISKSKLITWIWFLASISYVLYRVVVYPGYGIGYGNILVTSLPFSMGALLYYYKEILSRLVTKSIFIITLCVYLPNLLLPFFTSIYWPDKSWFFADVCTWINLFTTLIITVHLFSDGKNYFGKGMDKALGDLSYPVYIFHWTGALLAAYFIQGTSKYVIFAIGMMITVAISIIVNKVVNNNIEKVRQRIKSETTKIVTATK
jgi:peptidoglycan/LPS O-acetylase OafA/YrhL